jgi:hypothetical protein
MRIGRQGFLLLLALVSACDSAKFPVDFTTKGGDAWTFDKLVEARVDPAACSRVTFISQDGTATMHPQSERVFAHVPLRKGDNRIEVECQNNGLRSGQRASQWWRVSLNDDPEAHIRLRTNAQELLLAAARCRSQHGGTGASKTTGQVRMARASRQSCRDPRLARERTHAPPHGAAYRWRLPPHLARHR